MLWVGLGHPHGRGAARFKIAIAVPAAAGAGAGPGLIEALILTSWSVATTSGLNAKTAVCQQMEAGARRNRIVESDTLVASSRLVT